MMMNKLDAYFIINDFDFSLYKLRPDKENLVRAYARNCYCSFEEKLPFGDGIRRDKGYIQGDFDINFVKALTEVLRKIGFTVNFYLPKDMIDFSVPDCVYRNDCDDKYLLEMSI